MISQTIENFGQFHHFQKTFVSRWQSGAVIQKHVEINLPVIAERHGERILVDGSDIYSNVGAILANGIVASTTLASTIATSVLFVW